MRFVLALLAVLPAFARAQEPTKDQLEQFQKQLQTAHANVGPSLATIVVSRSDKYPKPEKTHEAWEFGRFDRRAFLKANPKAKDLADRLDLSDPESIPDHGFAGGAVIDSAGYVLTTWHAIEGATKIYVHLAGREGSYADIRAADSRCDLAVLKLLDPPADLKPIRFASVRLDDPKAGLARGSVGLVMGFAHTAGAALDKPKGGLAIVSQIRKPDVKGDAAALFSSIYNYSPLIEYESKFSTGASGAVLLNLNGEPIGLTTTTAALPPGEARAFALPLDGNLTRIIDVLRRGEEVEYGFLGVTRSWNQGGPRRGIPIDAHPGTSTPAGAAGLLPGDSIIKINDVTVSNFEDLLLHVGHGLAGRTITLTLQRGSKTFDVPVTLAKFKNEVPFVASVKPEPVFGVRVEFGSVLLQMQFNPFFGGRAFNEVPPGVLVREPLPDSPAEMKLKKISETARWVVTHVDGKAVRVPSDFYKAAAGKKSVSLTIVDANDAAHRPREVTLP